MSYQPINKKLVNKTTGYQPIGSNITTPKPITTQTSITKVPAVKVPTFYNPIQEAIKPTPENQKVSYGELARIKNVPGGGQYYTDPTYYKTEKAGTKGYGTFSKRTGEEIDHLIPASLGGTSYDPNLHYLKNNKTIIEKLLNRPAEFKNRQEGKVVIEQKAINDYNAGKISLSEARSRVLNWKDTKPNLLKLWGEEIIDMAIKKPAKIINQLVEEKQTPLIEKIISDHKEQTKSFNINVGSAMTTEEANRMKPTTKDLINLGIGPIDYNNLTDESKVAISKYIGDKAMTEQVRKGQEGIAATLKSSSMADKLASVYISNLLPIKVLTPLVEKITGQRNDRVDFAELIKQEQPVLSFVPEMLGQLTNFWLLGGVGNIAGKVATLPQTVRVASTLNPATSLLARATPLAARGATIFGLNNLISEVFDQVRSGKFNLKNIFTRTASGVAAGVVMGGASASMSPTRAVLSTVGSMAGLGTLETLIRKKSIAPEDWVSIAASSVAAGIFEAVGVKTKTRLFKEKELGDFSRVREIERIRNRNPDLSYKKAGDLIDLIQTLSGVKYGVVPLKYLPDSAYVQIIEKIPPSFSGLPSQTKYEYFNSVVDGITSGKTAPEAINLANGNILGLPGLNVAIQPQGLPPLPKLPTSETIPQVAPLPTPEAKAPEIASPAVKKAIVEPTSEPKYKTIGQVDLTTKPKLTLAENQNLANLQTSAMKKDASLWSLEEKFAMEKLPEGQGIPAIPKPKVDVKKFIPKKAVEAPGQAITPETAKVSTQPKITPESPLITEAKKYKSAEEFVKAQGTVGNELSSLGNDIPKKYVDTLFVREKVNLNDLSQTDHFDVGEYKQPYFKDMFSDAKSGKELPPIVADKNGNIIDGNHRLEAYLKAGRDYQYIYKEVPQTKSQLTDIWNKAQEAPTTPKINLYHGTDSSAGKLIDKSGLRFGDFLTTNKKEALDKYKERILLESPETLLGRETNKMYKGGGGYRYASKDKFAEIDLPDTQTNIQMPEMLKLAKELLGGKIPFLKKYPSAYGMFYSSGEIGLNPEIFKDPNQAVKTLAHEIGHLIDWLPDSIIHGGAGLLGRVMVIKDMRTQIIGQDRVLAKRKKIMTNIGRLKNIQKERILSVDGRIKLKDLQDDLKNINEKLVFNKDLQNELKKLTQWWKPFDDTIQGNGYSGSSYRYSSPELYADWISVLFNKPEVLPKMTPKFYQMFFENLDKKPAVKTAYFELMDFLSGTSDNILRAREIDIEKMFVDGEQLFRIKMEQAKQVKKSLWYSIKYNLFDKNIELIEKYNQAEKAGKIKNPEDNIKYLLEENNFVANEVKKIYDKFNVNRKKYLDSGLTDEQFGKILFLKRVMGDRSGLANPLGQNPHTAEKQLDFLKRQLGDKQFYLLEESVGVFNKLYETEVFDRAYKSGLIKQDLYDKIKNSDNIYGTFQTNKHILEGFVSGKIYHQVGTLDDIANPLPATMLKAAAFIRAINTNNIRKDIVKFLTDYYPKEIITAKVNHQTGMVKPAPNGMDVLRIKKNGVLKAYYVDEYIAKSMDMQTTDFNILVAKTIGWTNSHYFRPIYISFNLGFQSFNFMRDFIRTWKAVPNATLFGVAKKYFQSLSEAKARAFGISNKLIQEMEDNKVFGLTYNDIISGAEDDLSQTERLLQRYNLIPNKIKKIKYIQPLLWFFERIKLLGDVIETLPKVVGYKYLKSDSRFTPKDVAHIVRGRIGTPDFTRKGAAYEIYNNLFLFSNIMKEGYRSDFETAFQDPHTRSGYWYKTVKKTIIPKILMALAAAGYFGKKIKELMNKATEYDKTNYTVIPIGQDEKGNAIYIRIPDDETGRFIGALTWKLISAIKGGDIPAGLTDILSYTGGQLPSLSPTIQIPLSGVKMAMGQNPIDNFRQQAILTDDEMTAGGWRKWEPYLKWIFNQVGIGTVDVRDRVKDYTLLQQTLNFLPAPLNIVGRWVKVSSYGLSEENQKETTKILKQEAIKRLDKKDAIIKQTDKYYKGERDMDKLFFELDSAVYGGETVTNQQLVALHKSLIEKIISVKGDSNVNSLIYATTNEQKINLIKKIKSENAPDYINTIGQMLIAAKIISVETWNQGMK